MRYGATVTIPLGQAARQPHASAIAVQAGDFHVRSLRRQATLAGPAGTLIPSLRDTDRSPVTITFGIAQSPFGTCLIAASTQGICWLDIAPANDAPDALRSVWQHARLHRDDAAAARLVQDVFAAGARPAKLHLRGSEFQLRVWAALLCIQPGSYMTYGDLAQCIGAPHAARAVGSAVGANNVAVLVPCHRVVPAGATAVVGNYRWGPQQKRTLLYAERVSA